MKGIVWGPLCTGNPSSHVQLERPKKIGHWQLEKAAPKGNSLDLRRWCWSSDGLHNPAETPKEPAMRGAIRVGWTVSVLIHIFEDTSALKTHEQYFKSPGVFFFSRVILSKYGGSSSSIRRDKPDVVNSNLLQFRTFFHFWEVIGNSGYRFFGPTYYCQSPFTVDKSW